MSCRVGSSKSERSLSPSRVVVSLSMNSARALSRRSPPSLRSIQTSLDIQPVGHSETLRRLRVLSASYPPISQGLSLGSLYDMCARCLLIAIRRYLPSVSCGRHPLMWWSAMMSSSGPLRDSRKPHRFRQRVDVASVRVLPCRPVSSTAFANRFATADDRSSSTPRETMLIGCRNLLLSWHGRSVTFRVSPAPTSARAG